MTNILLIDTASSTTSVALCRGDECLVESDAGNRRAAQAALPMISRLLQDAELELGEIDAIAVVTGPGSFTGIRIGIGIAQGLCLANDIPALPVSTLAWYAQAAVRSPGGENFVVVLPAREDEVYCGLYQSRVDGVVLVEREQVAAPAQLQALQSISEDQWTGVSPAVQAWGAIAAALGIEIDASKDLLQPALADLVVLARFGLDQGQQVEAAALLPNYVKEHMQYTQA